VPIVTRTVLPPQVMTNPRAVRGLRRAGFPMVNGGAGFAGLAGLGAWDYDPMSGDWVETPSEVIPLDYDSPQYTVDSVPGLDPHANDGLPGNAPCDPNGLYPTGHRCALVQQYKDAQAVIHVVQTATGPVTPKPTAGTVPDWQKDLMLQAAKVTNWISNNSALFAMGVLGLMVVGSFSGGKGRR